MVPEGTIFIRQAGATERATRIDVEMLQDRLLSGAKAEGAISREAARKSELGEIVADLVQAGNRWADTMEILVMSSTGNEWKASDWFEWVNTDSGREMTKNAQSVDRNIRKLRLNAGEEALILPALEVQGRIRSGEAFAALHSGAKSTEDDRVSAYKELNAIRSGLAKLELSAIAMLTIPSSQRL